jgi:hypothetical protein
MNDNETPLASGEWWTHPWWKTPGREVYCPYPEQHLAGAADVLKRHFDAKWARNLAAHPRPNIVFPQLCIGGSMQALQFVVYLAEMVAALEGARGFGRLVAALKGDKGESSLLEMEAAYAFALAGHDVLFPREGGGKSPDVLISLGDTQLAIECKKLQSEAWEAWEDRLTLDLITALPRSKGDQPLAVDVALNPRLTQVCVSEENDPTLNEEFRAAIMRAVVDNISAAIAKNEVPFGFVINDLAAVRVTHETPDSLGQVSGMERGSPAVTRRILQNGILRACAQLPPEIPGVVFVYSKALPDPDFFRLFFDAACAAQPVRLAQLVVAILCPLQTLLQRNAPLIFLNKQTRFLTVQPTVLDVLTSKFGGIVVPPQ